MKKFDWKKVFPHLLAIGIFLIISVVYCKPALEGLQLQQSDVIHWKGMAQNSFEYKEQHGKFPLWTNGMFSGMPAYQIAMESENSFSIIYFQYILTLGLPKPISFFFLACICFYILMMVVRVNPWIGVLGALGYAFSTYNPVIIATGHDTKMMAIAYAPAVIGALLLLYRKQYWLGTMLLAIMLSLQVATSHIQVVYYTLIVAAALTIAFVIRTIKENDIKHVLTSLGIAIVIGIVSLGVTAVNTLTTAEYAKYSNRGGETPFTDTSKTATKGGLDKEYAFRWSQGVAETMTIFSAGIYGGSNGGREYTSSEFANKLTEIGASEEQGLANANGSSYWGKQPGTSGPVYLGAIICALFISAFFFTRSWHRWWILGAVIFAVILAWGKNFQAINYFLFDHLPLYKKFRAPAVSLVILQLCFPLLGCLALNDLLFNKEDDQYRLKQFRKASMALGAVAAVLALLYFSADFVGPNDSRISDGYSQAMLQQAAQNGQPSAAVQQQAADFGKSFVNALREDRKGLFQKDLLRTILLFAAFAVVIWLFLKRKTSAMIATLILLVLSTWDLLSVGRRYLYDELFVDSTTYDQAFAMSPADQQIKQDNGYYRVYNTTVDPFNDAITSYHHRTIGGYHPAKLQIYQDLIEHQIYKGNMNVFNMLNTKYFIQQNPQNGQPAAALNGDAYGPAWLVKGIKVVPDAKAAMSALDNTNLRDTAVIEQAFSANIAAISADSASNIQLIKNENDVINYQVKANGNQFAVLSEIYYPAGWKAFVDEKETPIIKTNYALRGVSIPSGDHKLTLRFEPNSYKLGNTIALLTSILVYVLVFVGCYFLWKRNKQLA